jgi:hypothetical protein
MTIVWRMLRWLLVGFVLLMAAIEMFYGWRR